MHMCIVFGESGIPWCSWYEQDHVYMIYMLYLVLSGQNVSVVERRKPFVARTLTG